MKVRSHDVTFTFMSTSMFASKFDAVSMIVPTKCTEVWCAPPDCQPYVLWQLPPDVNTSEAGGSQVNKFEQVSNDGHQMSLARDRARVSGNVMSDVWEWGLGCGLALYHEVQCIMGNGHIWSPCGQTDTTENITFPQLHLQAVIRLKSSIWFARNKYQGVKQSRCFSYTKCQNTILKYTANYSAKQIQFGDAIQMTHKYVQNLHVKVMSNYGRQKFHENDSLD